MNSLIYDESGVVDGAIGATVRVSGLTGDGSALNGTYEVSRTGATMTNYQKCLMCGGRVPEGMACKMPCPGGSWPTYVKDNGGFAPALQPKGAGDGDDEFNRLGESEIQRHVANQRVAKLEAMVGVGDEEAAREIGSLSALHGSACPEITAILAKHRQQAVAEVTKGYELALSAALQGIMLSRTHDSENGRADLLKVAHNIRKFMAAAQRKGDKSDG